MSHERNESLHGDIERLLSQSSSLLKQERSSRSLSRADTGGNSVVSATFKRPSSGSPLASPSLRTRHPESETLKLDHPSSSKERSRLSFSEEPRGLTLSSGSRLHRDLDEPRTPVGRPASSPLLGGWPMEERRSSSPGTVHRPHRSMDGSSSPTFMLRSASSASPSPLNPAHTSLHSSLKAGQQAGGGSGIRRTTTFGTPLVSDPPGSRILSAQSTGRSLSPSFGVSKSTPSTRPGTSAGPASPRPSSAGAGLTSRGSTGTGLAGSPSHTRQPEVAEWQATVKELSRALDAQGRTAKQDVEKRIAELNGRVANWDGLINKISEDFDKSMDVALKEIYSRARLKLHPSLRPPALDLKSAGSNSDRRSLVDEPSFDAHSLAPSLSGNRTNHSMAAMPTPDPLPFPSNITSPRAPPSPRTLSHPNSQPQNHHYHHQQQQLQVQRQHSPFTQLSGDARNPGSQPHSPSQAQAFSDLQPPSGPPQPSTPPPPQLASPVAAQLWASFASSRAYCPYKNPGTWVHGAVRT